MSFHSEVELGMTTTSHDPAIYVEVDGGTVEGSIYVYVDDNFIAGYILFRQEMETSLQSFDSKPRVFDNFDFLADILKIIFLESST